MKKSGYASAPSLNNYNVLLFALQPETRQALENIKAILESVGGSMSNIVKCTGLQIHTDLLGAAKD